MTDRQADRRMDGRTDRQTDRVITIGYPPSGGALIISGDPISWHSVNDIINDGRINFIGKIKEGSTCKIIPHTKYGVAFVVAFEL